MEPEIIHSPPIGVRRWRLDLPRTGFGSHDDFRLLPLIFKSIFPDTWTGPVASAEGFSLEPTGDYMNPVGLYSYRWQTLPRALSNGFPTHMNNLYWSDVVGVVSNFGKCGLGPDGIVSERARVERLIISGYLHREVPETKERLETRYRCPVTVLSHPVGERPTYWALSFGEVHNVLYYLAREVHRESR